MVSNALDSFINTTKLLNAQNRRFYAVLAGLMAMILAVDGVLNELRTRRITSRLETTPGDVREAVQSLAIAQEAKHSAIAESLYFSDVLETANDCFVQIDSKGFINRWSRGAEQMFGYQRQEALGLHVSILMPAEAMEKHRDKYNLAVSSDTEVNRRRLLEVVALNSDGKPLSVRLQLWIAPRLGAVARVVKTGKPADLLIRQSVED